MPLSLSLGHRRRVSLAGQTHFFVSFDIIVAHHHFSFSIPACTQPLPPVPVFFY
jgi:hypothetical protein